MIININVPNSYQNKLELEATINSFLQRKLLARSLDKSKIVSIKGSLRKVGRDSKFTIDLKYGKREYQVIKKDKDPFVASINALKSLKRLCLESNNISMHDAKRPHFASMISPSAEQFTA